jgi:hypothetical protein
MKRTGDVFRSGLWLGILAGINFDISLPYECAMKIYGGAIGAFFRRSESSRAMLVEVGVNSESSLPPNPERS